MQVKWKTRIFNISINNMNTKLIFLFVIIVYVLYNENMPFNKKLLYEKCWNKIPLIQCISLRDRDDRYKEICNEFINIGIPINEVEFHRPIKNSIGQLGCVLSHIACFKKALDRNVSYTLIIEDDCKFIKKDIYNKLIEGINLIENDNYDMIKLGWNSRLYESMFKKYKLRKQSKTMLTHCYLISRKAIKKIIPILENDMKKYIISIDLFFQNVNLEQYTLGFPICIQRKSKSNIDRKYNYISNYKIFEICQQNPILINIIGCIINLIVYKNTKSHILYELP
jgi:GR25 family glycosyltransferase involved in LPS biosynthesis